MRDKNKGSLTVEATISLTLFIFVMLLFLTIIRFVVLEYVLTYAAHESAKSIADVSYLVGIVNAWQEEGDDYRESTLGEQAKSFSETTVTDTVPTILKGLIGYKMETNKKKADGILRGAAFEIGTDVIKGVAGQMGGNIYSILYDDIASFKEQMKYQFVKDSLGAIGTQAVILDESKIMMEFIKFPETQNEYFNSMINASVTNGLNAGVDFEKDDAVVIVSYKTKINLPFLPHYELKFRKIAIEKGWTNGECDIVTAFEGNGALSQIISMASDLINNRMVYISDGGNKFHHNPGCSVLLGKNATSVFSFVAERQGFSSHSCD